jgi:small redox-active disulfide protein 2
MKKVQILGTGCPKCNKLYELACLAVEQDGLDAEVVKVSNINEIINFGIMVTPALAVDGEVKVSGKLPTIEEIKSYIAT